MSQVSKGGASYSKVDASYFDKRQLKRSAGFWGLWGMGIAAVISGDFSGWNSGLAATGWGPLLIATIIIVVLYFTMIFSIGEMSAAMPHTGGAYSFARAAMGPWGGFITGLAESIEYVVTTAVVVLFSAYYADEALKGLTGVSLPPFVWWAILYLVFIGLNSLGASIGFRFAVIVALISMAVIVLFSVIAIASGAVDFGKLFDLKGSSGQTGEFFPFGPAAIFVSLPFAIWFFLGIEELPLAAEEAHNPSRDIPRASVWGVVTLAVFAFLVLFLNTAVTGTAAVAAGTGAGEPLLEGFRVLLGTKLASLLAIFALVGLLASLQGIMFAAGRNMYSLSRAGYYPKFLSLTGKKHQTPWVAIAVGSVIGYIILLIVQWIGSLSASLSAAANGIILFIAVFGAVISYTMQMVAFVVLRRRFPNAVRPYKSPTGVVGAVVAGIISFAAFLGIVISDTFRPAVVCFLIIFVVGLALFALVGRKRLVLSPEEEYALSGGLHRDPEVEDYTADQKDILG